MVFSQRQTSLGTLRRLRGYVNAESAKNIQPVNRSVHVLGNSCAFALPPSQRIKQNTPVSDESSCRLCKRTTNNMVLVGTKVIDINDHSNKPFANSKPKANILKCEKHESRNENLYASFKLTNEKEDTEKVLASDFWPYEICVRKFFQRRTRAAERG
ncbi:hypothetical protein HHI36_018724 [Cryptolaemus montrouzieri]|uniref:Uncharacterized protein n=1 Tax=Cryptolaemus montrouzieri TaxID=559131 RepID=A0ABD2P0X0_9CUCU